MLQCSNQWKSDFLRLYLNYYLLFAGIDQMSSYLSSIGISLPQYRINQKNAASNFSFLLGLDNARKIILEKIFENTTIEHRYSVLDDYVKSPGEFTFFSNTEDGHPIPTTAMRMKIYQASAIDLALEAVKKCLNQPNGCKHKEITHLITVSCTGMYAPGIDVDLTLKLGLNKDVQRICINFMGCHGAFPALRVADAICQSNKNACVLVVCIELSSLHLERSQAVDNIVSSALFSDGCAAALVKGNTSDEPCIKLEDFHSTLINKTSDLMTWTIGNHGFHIFLSGQVANSLEEDVGDLIRAFLQNSKVQLRDIDLFAIHPGGIRILEACEKAFEINTDKNRFSRETLKDYGNMSSVTILFVLKNIMQGLYKKDSGRKMVAVGFGPGLTLETFFGVVA